MSIVQDLQITRDKSLSLYDLGQSDLEKTYAPGKWSVRALLHHLADAESVLYDRIRRGISKPEQVVWGFDQDAWAAHLHYDQKPLALSKSVFNACRENVIYLATHFYASHGSNLYVHNETGLRTVKDEFDKVVWHNEHHLEQIRKALN